jgi:hypothetical protein
LAEAQRRTDERLAELAEAQQRADVWLTELTAEVRALTAQVAQLARQLAFVSVALERLSERAGRLDGWLLEYEYRSKPDAFLGERLRPPRAVAPGDLVEQLEPCASAQDLRDWSKVDLVVHGRAADRPDRPEVWPVVERAVRRAS